MPYVPIAGNPVDGESPTDVGIVSGDYNVSENSDMPSVVPNNMSANSDGTIHAKRGYTCSEPSPSDPADNAYSPPLTVGEH